MKELEERLINIETALMNQEKIIEELNAVIIQQAQKIEHLAKQNQYLLSMADEDTIKPLSEETPPPHY